MKLALFCIFCGILMVGVSWGQNSPANNPQAAGAQGSSTPTATTQPPQAADGTHNGLAKRIASGSIIPVVLTKTVDAKKAKVGEAVTAKVADDLKSSTGEILIPKNTKVIGHITEVQPRTKEQKESQLAIAFDQTVAKDGLQMQMPMSIQAVISFQSNGPNNAEPNSTGAAPQPPAGGASSPAPGGRAMGGGSSAPATNSGSMNDTGAQSGSSSNSRPPITAQTEGVIGISNLALKPAATPAEGSVLSSEKNNVKLESDTMMLLRVD